MLVRSFVSANAVGVRAFCSTARVIDMVQTLTEIAAAAPKAVSPSNTRPPTRLGIPTSKSTDLLITEENNTHRALKESLSQRMLSLISSERSDALTVIRKWKYEGRVVEKKEVYLIIQDLNRSNSRLMCNQGLQLCGWLAQQKGMELQPVDFAMHLHLIAKVRGETCAEIFFKAMPKTMRGKHAFWALLKCYIRKKSALKAGALMKQMVEKGFVNRPNHFHPILSLYVQIRQFDKFFETMEELKRRTRPTAETYLFLFRVCALRDDVEEAERLFSEMKMHGMKPNWEPYTVLARLYIKRNRFGDANRILSDMEGMGFLNRKAFRSLLSLYACIENMGEVFRIWDRMKSELKIIFHSDYAALMLSLVERGLLEKADDLFREWVSACETKPSHVPNILLSAYCNKGDLEKADNLYSRMLKNGVEATDIDAKEIMVRGFLKGRRVTKSKEILKKAVGFCSGIESLLRLVYGSIEEDADIGGAEQVLKMLRKSGRLDAKTYRCLIRTYAREGKMVPSVKERMASDRVEMDEEIRRLLSGVV